MIKYMLDTNILIYAIKNRPKKVRETFKSHSDYLSMSSVTLGELIYGAERSVQVTRNLQDIESLAARMDVLPFDYLAATHFGQLRAELTKKGKPIGPYDSMLAGHARSLGLILVTNNMREFKRVPGLRVENWSR
jgi:tRNA(fMet)-specific endonuclease VapC